MIPTTQAPSEAALKVLQVLNEIYKRCNNDNETFVRSLVQSGKATHEREARQLAQTFQRQKHFVQ